MKKDVPLIPLLPARHGIFKMLDSLGWTDYSKRAQNRAERQRTQMHMRRAQYVIRTWYEKAKEDPRIAYSLAYASTWESKIVKGDIHIRAPLAEKKQGFLSII